MAEDLAPYGITANLLLPGGATDTGMIPDGLIGPARRSLLKPEIMGPPVVFLASPEAAAVTGHRIVALDFDTWLVDYRSHPQAGP
jgi:NAD(P)-dependent dehydrogenase (short-subunit alcohol dehydrogenase family)